MVKFLRTAVSVNISIFKTSTKLVHVFREMGAEPHSPPASISQITDLFQLAQVGKYWESPEYAPAPQRMSI